MKINNRTFIISGGSSGLGLATARDILSSKGYVAILDRKPFPNVSGDELEPSTSRLLYINVDITDVAKVSDAVETVASWTHRTGARLGGVINCAGIGTPELLVSSKGVPHSQSHWDRIVGVNLHGTFHLTRFAAKHLVLVPPEETPDRERGVVIMVSSTVAYEGLAGQTAYAASKGAICSMTLPMARDLARHNIRVVTLVPGPFATPLTDQFGAKIAEELHRDAVLYPRRYGRPEEFAQTVKWVVECPIINGENLKVTGGTRMPSKM
ncbi:hypothetical protein PQX77_012397 [Marasmius sp. AFHP31]|nr:hypothetical protein PQX77_012397 [Marasmius sp. AFHP31]